MAIVVKGRTVVLIIVVVALTLAIIAAVFRVKPVQRRTGQVTRIPGDEGTRVVVEVLNTTDAVGLARAATRRLRDAGFDVVYFGSDAGAALDSTLVLARTDDTGPASRVMRTLGVGAVRAAADAGRQVDVTVRLGRDFASGGALVRDP